MQGSKDNDSGAAVYAVCGVSPASGNMLQQNSTQQEKQKSCALGTVVENGIKSGLTLKQLKMPFVGLIRNMHQQNYTLQEKEKNCGEGTVVKNGSKKRANVEAASGENKRNSCASEYDATM